MEVLSRLPAYALRKYGRIYTRGIYRLINTHFATYVLDIPTLEGDYYTRRVQMVAMDLPHKLYPLSTRITTLAQLLNTKYSVFIDSEGVMFKHVKQRLCQIKYTKVYSADVTWNGKYLLHTKLATPLLSEEPCNYVGYLEVGRSVFLYETCTEPKKTRRVKI